MKTYKVGQLRQIMREEKDEFKPVLGKNVASDDKRINREAYKDMSKATDDYNPKSEINKPGTDSRKYDYNRGMEYLSYNPDTMSKSFKNKVHSQLNGYTSEENEKLHKNDAYGNADFGTVTKEIEDKVKQNEKDKLAAQQIGITQRTNGSVKNKRLTGDTAFGESVSENKVIRRLKFKNTKFLSENHMLSKIPEEYKKDKKYFIMEDNSGEKYYIKWNENTPRIVKHEDNRKLNEQLSKIQSLFNPKNDSRQISGRKEDENDENGTLSEMIKLNRKLQK